MIIFLMVGQLPLLERIVMLNRATHLRVIGGKKMVFKVIKIANIKDLTISFNEFLAILDLNETNFIQ